MPVRLEQIDGELGAHGITPVRIAIGVALWIALLAASITAVIVVLVRLPPTYFVEQHAGAPARWTAAHIARTVAKNVLGVALVVAGVLLSLPGIPGQGVLTILLGVMLLDVPGKKRLERAIVSRRHVLASINRLRERHGREPLRV